MMTKPFNSCVFVLICFFLVHLGLGDLGTAEAAVFRTSTGGISNFEGYPKFTMMDSSASIDLLPDNTYYSASVQFLPVSFHKVFSIRFKYEICDDDGGPVWNSADGIALMMGKTVDSYDSLGSLPIGGSLGVLRDGHGISIQFKTYGWNRGIYIVDGRGKVLKRVRDQKTYTNCQRVPVRISVDARRRLVVKKGRGKNRILRLLSIYPKPQLFPLFYLFRRKDLLFLYQPPKCSFIFSNSTIYENRRLSQLCLRLVACSVSTVIYFHFYFIFTYFV